MQIKRDKFDFLQKHKNYNLQIIFRTNLVTSKID